MSYSADHKPAVFNDLPLIDEAAAHALMMGEENLKGAIRMTFPERQVIDLIVGGMSNLQIAEQMKIETFMVKSHVNNILDKLALHNCIGTAKGDPEKD